MKKNIAFVYDSQSVYGIEDCLSYSDFCYDDEAEYFKKSLESLGGYDVTLFCGIKNFFDAYNSGKKFDMVFNKCEGFGTRNREGLFPALLEFYNIPFVGTDAYGLSLSLNKFHTKLIAEYYEIPIPKFELISRLEDIEKTASLKYPLIVKPNSEGSSMGVVIVEDSEKLKRVVNEISDKYGYPLICEEYIYGHEVSVPIIGTGNKARALSPIEFKQNDGNFFPIYSTEAKYYSGCQTLFFDGSEQAKKVMTDSALKIYRALGCRDFGRADYRVRGNEAFLLEINPLPTLSEHGSFELWANSNNSSFAEILEEIIKSAEERYGIK
ncbi:MAG: ATP-grasp domain-containing protein [Synergistales bacterium]|nr:ATP-grasp domain-containing protein [Synergistales bacterium]MDY6401838.1 ATP-grasp domain-containing protein [Synergistales bacterium]MDY6403852.1 ATP-grasp domain-containing protein [Synergistales bacterium]MDY6409926.1 ATP-grasp domain-containing protein [Synergistales bacterium]MDY6415188.1 ATP-grasp domain-containing protein [Synergistales bacterium]